MQKGNELITLAQRIRSMSQTGLSYSTNDYEIDRCKELIEISNRITAIVTGVDEDEIDACYLPIKEYVTPKVDIRAVVFNEKGEVLLVREKMDGRWSMPGGWADVGYTPGEVAVKETKEETGLDVRAERLLAVMDKRCHPHPASPFYIYKFFILCELLGGTFTETFDILDKGFFDLEQLPPLSLDRVLPEQIRLMDALRRNPSATVYMD
ncbi:MAG: NUDIX hydrolase N-terminal domain-containing protein [Tannerella sp.]|jgi:ADP-ribose pyrophosphatase YjhB (NUDIX family)|nr:NUDIX hydrolase N-terminal domain-containing protein [Tannerella sp.]